MKDVWLKPGLPFWQTCVGGAAGAQGSSGELLRAPLGPPGLPKTSLPNRKPRAISAGLPFWQTCVGEPAVALRLEALRLEAQRLKALRLEALRLAQSQKKP